jgi:aspartyl-tRNA(Asn)/glutamyl-tRNA(Gln) amidotransferase subunit A
MDPFPLLTLTEAAQGLRAGEISAQQLMQATLDRIRLVDPLLKAFLYLDPHSALAAAELADRQLADWRRHRQAPLPPLTGLPVAVKDVLCVEGMPATAGSLILQGFIPPYSATSVARLMAAGAIIIGKTNTDEFAMGSSTENSAYGPTHNPWDTARVPGGSSGGSAAAVAAGLCLAALGTDTGGSIRQPAAFCGVTGLKTSYGRVSRYGLIAYGSSLDTVGALAHSAEDLVPLLDAMGGRDHLDSTSLPGRPDTIAFKDSGDLTSLRLGVPEEYFIEGMQPDVERAVRQAVEVFASLGAEVHTVNLPHTDLALPVYYLIAPAEASANLARFDGIRYGPRRQAGSLMDSYLETRGALFGPEVKRRIMLGTYALSAGYYDAYYGQAQKVRTLIKADFDQVFADVDLIACPVTPTTAFPIGSHGDDPLSMYLEDVFTLPANLAGIPGISFPVGFDPTGLPIGMQLNAPHLGEALLLRAAHAYQGQTRWHKERPPL